MRRLMMSLLSATTLAFSFTTLAAAQDNVARAAYDASATVPTNVPGIRTFNTPPPGFNPLAASDEELATYGFPPHPNQQVDAEHYAKWAKAMAAAKNRWNGELKVTDVWSEAGRRAQAPAGVTAVSAGPSTQNFSNWSGFINTNTLTKYSTTSSFYFVVSDFNVPIAQQAFKSDGFETGKICDGGWDSELSWNGIDGDLDLDGAAPALLQGGTSSGAYCNGGTASTEYFAWIEWWPSYPIIEEFNVNPGDDFYVETWDTSATQGYVFLDDLTTQTYSTHGISPKPGQPGLIGNSAEYIVEREGGGSGLYPLANYVQDFWSTSYAFNFYDHDHDIASPFYPGSTSASTVLVNMIDDAGDQVISHPEAQGKNGIFFQDEHCAEDGGCVR
jgi:Peptidase A4 family